MPIWALPPACRRITAAHPAACGTHRARCAGHHDRQRRLRRSSGRRPVQHRGSSSDSDRRESRAPIARVAELSATRPTAITRCPYKDTTSCSKMRARSGRIAQARRIGTLRCRASELQRAFGTARAAFSKEYLLCSRRPTSMQDPPQQSVPLAPGPDLKMYAVSPEAEPTALVADIRWKQHCYFTASTRILCQRPGYQAGACRSEHRVLAAKYPGN